MKFLKELRRRIFPSIIALSALSVSASAAFYSVSGLSKLFAGASFEVIVMASSLEIAKLVIASLLYQYWGKLNKLLKIYLTISAFVLVGITSAGIYGFLSAAYQETATKSEIVDSEVGVLELKKSRFEENRTYYIEEKSQLDQSITELRKGLSNNVIQYRDSETGQIITTTSSSTRKALQKELENAVVRRDDISQKLENVTDSISGLEVKILETSSNAELASELGPLKYLSELTNKPMNQIINILLLVIIFVFDPLAISLVIAANFAFDQLRKKNTKEEDDNDEMWNEEEMEDFRNQFPEPELSEEWEESHLYDLQDNSSKLKDEDVEINEISKEAGKMEKEMVKDEPKPLQPTDELINRLELELNKITSKKDETEKTNQITDDLLRKINKLSEMIDLDVDEKTEEEVKEEPKEAIKEEPQVTPTPNKKRIIYRRRDGGSSTRIDRI
jgi:hypothetical protein